MKSAKIMAGLALAGGLAAGAVGISTGVANADPGPGLGPVPAHWGPPPPPGPGWGPPPPPAWGGPGPAGWGPPAQQDVPFPGGWNGGWEPNGGLCIGPFCV